MGWSLCVVDSKKSDAFFKQKEIFWLFLLEFAIIILKRHHNLTKTFETKNLKVNNFYLDPQERWLKQH